MNRVSRLGVLAAGASASVAALVLALTPTRPVSAQSSPDAARAMQVLAAVRGSEPLVCEFVLQALNGNFGWRGQRPAEIPDDGTELQDVVQWAMQRRADPSVVSVFRPALGDADACVRRVAARLLGRTHHASAVEALTNALRDANPTTRQMGAIGLGYAEDHIAVPELLRLTNDAASDVRAAVAWALGEIEDHRAVVPLTRMLENDPEPRVRRAAAAALGMMY